MNDKNKLTHAAMNQMMDEFEARLAQTYGEDHNCVYVFAVRVPHGDGVPGYIYLTNIDTALNQKSFLERLLAKAPVEAALREGPQGLPS
jgi:hypothetical protein